jgi:L-malate glycosyltransferase
MRVAWWERNSEMKLLATTTLNPNQLRAYLQPILEVPEIEEVVLVADAAPPPLPKVRVVVPSSREIRLLGRAGSKLHRCVRLARALKPTWIVSYNIMPHGVNAYIAARASGTRTVYHMIGGEIEWRGGGWQGENAILGRLSRPVPMLERSLLNVIKHIDVVCTMGTGVRERLLAEGLDADRVVVTPPSVDADRFCPNGSVARRYDIVTAGRLVPIKRLSDFIEVVRRLHETRPNIRAAIAGTGPLEVELRKQATAADLTHAIDFLGARTDIENVYRSARIFLLTSQSEGLSVAMTEAMASGLPAVVTDVGDLRDLVEDGVNGHLLPVGDVEGLTDRVAGLLDDDQRLGRASQAARRSVLDHSSVERLSAIYRRIFVEGA